MLRLSPERPGEVIRKLRALGFDGPYGGGKHAVMRHSVTKKKIPVPTHGTRTLPIGTLRAIVRAVGCTVQDWNRL